MKDTLYAIYKFDFHQATNRSVIAESNGVDDSKNVKFAQKCFDSLFDENTIDNLIKTNNKGESTRLPNDVMAKIGEIYIWRVNNSLIKDWWTKNGRIEKVLTIMKNKKSSQTLIVTYL